MHGLERERGTTLVGELLAIAIIGTVVVVLLSGLSASGLGVAVVRQRVTAENYARQEMEAIKMASYRANPTTVPYPMVTISAPYSMSVGVRYWISPTFTVSVPVSGTDQGLQEITIDVYAEQATTSPVFTLQGYKGERP